MKSLEKTALIQEILDKVSQENTVHGIKIQDFDHILILIDRGVMSSVMLEGVVKKAMQLYGDSIIDLTSNT